MIIKFILSIIYLALSYNSSYVIISIQLTFVLYSSNEEYLSSLIQPSVLNSSNFQIIKKALGCILYIDSIGFHSLSFNETFSKYIFLNLFILFWTWDIPPYKSFEGVHDSHLYCIQIKSVLLFLISTKTNFLISETVDSNQSILFHELLKSCPLTTCSNFHSQILSNHT